MVGKPQSCPHVQLTTIDPFASILLVSTVDGWNPAPVEVGSLSHHLKGFIHLRWLFGISSINSSDQLIMAYHHALGTIPSWILRYPTPSRHVYEDADFSNFPKILNLNFSGMLGGIPLTTKPLVGGWTNPSEKYQSNWIISPSRGEDKTYFETTA